MKNSLKEKYARDEDDYELALTKMNMTKDEDPIIFTNKVERICRKINPKMSDTAIISKICQRVSPSIRKELLHRSIKSVKELYTNLQQIHKNRQRFKDDNDEILTALKAVQVSLEEKKEIIKKDEPVNFIPQTNNQPKPQFNRYFPQNPTANFPYPPFQQNPFAKFSGFQAPYHPIANPPNQFPNTQFFYPSSPQRRFPNRFTSPNFQPRIFPRPNFSRPPRNNFPQRQFLENNQPFSFPPTDILTSRATTLLYNLPLKFTLYKCLRFPKQLSLARIIMLYMRKIRTPISKLQKQQKRAKWNKLPER